MISSIGSKSPKALLKMALIPALILVLVAVVFWPSGGETVSTETSLVPAIATTNSTKTDAKLVAVKWPSVPLNELVAFNPFEPYEVPPTHEEPVTYETQPTAGLGAFTKLFSSDTLGAFKTFWPSSVSQTMSTSNNKSTSNDRATRYTSIGTLKAVYFDARGAAAILDSRVVRVGDTLPSGQRIVEITEQGIKLEDVH